MCSGRITGEPMQLSIEVPQRTLDVARDLKAKAKGIKSAVLKGAKNASTQLSAEVIKGLSGKNLKMRSGAMIRGVKGRAAFMSDGVEIGVGITKGPATAYAEKQEEGGEIRAKPGKALPVPLDPVRRKWAVTKSPSQLPYAIREKLFMVSRKKEGKPPLLGITKGRGANFEAWYVLVKKVDITPSHWLSGPVEQHAPRIVRHEIIGAVDRHLEAGR